MPPPLRLTSRQLFAGILGLAGMAYLALLVTAYLYITLPSSLGPSLGQLDQLLFPTTRPTGPMERRLEASDTPLGTGPLISGKAPPEDAPSMRFAFENPPGQIPLTPVELREREGERLALLDWIRSGASQKAYAQDDYELLVPLTLTPQFVVGGVHENHSSGSQRVRIRSLINERCCTCHNDQNGDDTAHLIPFDSYPAIARYLAPDPQGEPGRSWLIALLAALFPLASLVCPAFARTSHPPVVRRCVIALTLLAFAVLAASWFIGSLVIGVLFAAALVALTCILLQLLASVAELLSEPKV